MQDVMMRPAIGKIAHNEILRTRAAYRNLLAAGLFMVGVACIIFLLYTRIQALHVNSYGHGISSYIIGYMIYFAASLPIGASIILYDAACKLSAQMED